MYFKQFYLGCLAHASYLIGSKGLACVVDPQREIDEYIEEAKAQNLTIKYIIETHLHADFVGGHKELADKTGAEIVFSHKAKAKFPHKEVADGDIIELGSLSLEILETPGHTHESICILIKDTEAKNEPGKLLTGDTLFIGDVGRPDLVGAQGSSQEEMAAVMYESIRDKILVLDDETEVYPAHGAGSLCGKNLSTERSSTIGQQRKFNYALQAKSKDEFVALLCDKLPEIPMYFPVAVEANRAGACSLNDLPSPKSLNPKEVIEKMESGSVLIDLRPNDEFGKEHIQKSMNVALGGQFASWTGQLIKNQSSIVLFAPSKDSIDEAITRLARAGHESVSGYFVGSTEDFKEIGCNLVKTPQITPANLKEKIENDKDLQIIDVRRDTEFNNGHVPNAINLSLPELEKRISEIAKDKATAVICRSGYRSSIGTSILEKHGMTNLMNVKGGTMAWIDAGFEVHGVTNDSTTCQTA